MVWYRLIWYVMWYGRYGIVEGSGRRRRRRRRRLCSGKTRTPLRMWGMRRRRGGWGRRGRRRRRRIRKEA